MMSEEGLEKLDICSECTDAIVEYYEKDMGHYKAHVFLCAFTTFANLKKYWKTIANEIAVEYQSRIPSVIERANFYIGYFSKELVNNELQNIIEQDPYCARKYVFDRTEQWMNRKRTIDDHIFGLNLKDISKSGDRKKLYKIELQNFRGYADRNIFDLTDRNGKPASFILVYAPNGIGKTSFTDGIEFALKGNVDRLIRLEKKAKHKGPVYHHYDRVGQKAYVQLFVGNDSMRETPCNPRQVPKYENGSDTNTDNRSYKEFKCKQKDWDMVILPHDKIDSFITANSPEQRFESWTKSDPKISHIADELKKERKELKEKEKERDAAFLATENQKKIIEDLDLKREGIRYVIELQKEYNSMTVNEKEKLPAVKYNDKVQSFSNLITEAKALLEECQIELDKLQAINYRIDTWKRSGLENCDLRYEEFQNKEKEKQQLKIEQELVAKRKLLKEHLEQVETRLREAETSLHSYVNLEAYGIEKFFSELIEFRKNTRNVEMIEQKISELDSTILECQKNTEKIERELRNGEILIQREEETLKKAKCLEKKQKQYESIEKLLDYISKEEKEIAVKKWNLDFSFVNQSYVTTEQKNRLSEIDAEIHSLQDGLEKVNSEIHKLLTEHTENKSAIQEMQTHAIQYLEKNRDICQCPVCHSKFESWEKLVFSIKNIKEGEKKAYKIQIEEKTKEREVTQKKYDVMLNEASEVLTGIMTSLLEKQKELDSEIENEKEWFISSDIEITGKNSVIENVLDFYASKRIKVAQSSEKRSQLCKKIVNLNSEKDKLVKEKNNNQSKLSKWRSEHLALLKEAELVEVDYNCGKWSKLKENFIVYRNKTIELKEEINILDEKHSEIIFLSDEILNEKSHENEKWIEENISFANEYAPYFQKAELLDLECQKNKEKYEICWNRAGKLRRIINEEGVKDYLNLWEKAEAEYDLKLKAQKNAQESYMKCCSNYDGTEKRLKKKLEEYFSQENANIIYQKIDPNNDLTDMNISLTFGEDNRPQLSYEMVRKDEREKGYTAEIYLSTAQLNAVAFSSFFARALTEKQVDIHSIIIDDPIGSFDDMNILGFADLIRSIIMHTDIQIIMTTHDSKIFDIMKRKLNEQYHSSRFYRLPDDLETIEVDDPEI